MNITELKTPIRLYWDLPSRPADTNLDYQGICEQIISLRILSLGITEPAPALRDGCLTILDRLKKHPIALSLTVCSSALDAATLSALHGSNVRLLLVRATKLDDLRIVTRLMASDGPKPPLGVSFEVRADNFGILPEALSYCIGNGIRHLVLPMQRLNGDEDCFHLERSGREALTSCLAAIDRPADLKITIHDPFLWRVFFPAVSFPDGSCQAANTMLYIDGNGDVHPCPTLPYRLGNLAHTTLRAIVESAEKTELRKRLTIPPAGCTSCAELDQCRGGCRGRGHFLTESWDGADPGCR